MNRRRKIITRVIVFLLLGAIVNVAVAWGCAVWWQNGPCVTIHLMSQWTEQWHATYAHFDSAGWPTRSLAWRASQRPFRTSVAEAMSNKWEQERLPVRPRVFGFAINTIFYAAILAMLFFAPGSVRRAFRRRRGLCPDCAYPIGTSPVCTECGTTLLRGDAESDKRTRFDTAR